MGCSQGSSIADRLDRKNKKERWEMVDKKVGREAEFKGDRIK